MDPGLAAAERLSDSAPQFDFDFASSCRVCVPVWSTDRGEALSSRPGAPCPRGVTFLSCASPSPLRSSSLSPLSPRPSRSALRRFRRRTRSPRRRGSSASRSSGTSSCRRITRSLAAPVTSRARVVRTPALIWEAGTRALTGCTEIRTTALPRPGFGWRTPAATSSPTPPSASRLRSPGAGRRHLSGPRSLTSSSGTAARAPPSSTPKRDRSASRAAA